MEDTDADQPTAKLLNSCNLLITINQKRLENINNKKSEEEIIEKAEKID